MPRRNTKPKPKKKRAGKGRKKGRVPKKSLIGQPHAKPRVVSLEDLASSESDEDDFEAIHS